MKRLITMSQPPFTISVIFLLGSIFSHSSSYAANNQAPQLSAYLERKIEIAMHASTSKPTTFPRYNQLDPEKMLAMAASLPNLDSNSSNAKLAFALTYSAALKDSAEAQFRLANIYLQNEILPRDEEQAVFWLEKAVAKNHVGANFVYQSLLTDDFGIGC